MEAVVANLLALGLFGLPFVAIQLFDRFVLRGLLIDERPQRLCGAPTRFGWCVVCIFWGLVLIGVFDLVRIANL
jgi:hypothetical protein